MNNFVKDYKNPMTYNTEKSVTATAENHQDWLNTQTFDPGELDYSLLDKHIELLTQLARVSNTGITVYDMYRQKHVFTSYNFTELFGYDWDKIVREDTTYFTTQIHPDDVEPLNRNGYATWNYFWGKEKRPEALYTKLISEYRIRIGERYVRVIEQYQPLELDPSGNVWLSLSVLDVSPNQAPLEKVQSKLMNCRTGEMYTLAEFDTSPQGPLLSHREKEVLELIRKGLLSKEISQQLMISVHTVNTHRQRILEKLSADNSMEAVRYASRFGLLD